MSCRTPLLRLKTRLLQRCAHFPSRSTLPCPRALHTTPAARVTGPQRAQFTEELQRRLQKDDLLGSGRGKLDFDKSPLEEQDKKAVRRKTEPGDTGQTETTPGLTELVHTELDQCEFESNNLRTDPEYQTQTESVGSEVETASDQSCVETIAPPGGEEFGQVPENIVGDLESLFTDVSAPEPVVTEQEGVVETLGSTVDYNVYYNSVEGERTVMPERALGLRELNRTIPLHHIVQFIRDFKCFDTEVIQAREGMYVDHVIITSVHNTKHLKDASRSFFKMCRDDYDMSMSNNEKSNTGQAWKAFDVGHCVLHIFLPAHRAKFNLESFWLGQDAELEDPEQEEDRYTSDLLEGLFPDEDFTKLGKPFELFRDSKDKQ